MNPLQTLPWQASIANWWAGLEQADRIPHSLLLSGPLGVGKRALADQLCMSLYGNDEQALRLYQAGTHPDFFQVGLVEKRKEVSVAQIRELSNRVTLTSQFDGWRVVLVDPADRLSRGAANALLKILEEPPARVMFILVADELHRVLPTIRSRCQQLKLTLPSRADAQAWLSQQPQVSALTQDEMTDWLALVGGSPLRVIDALSADDEDDVPDLELASQRQQLLEQLIAGKLDAVSVADGLVALHVDIAGHLNWLHGFALDLLKFNNGLDTVYSTNRRAADLLSRLGSHVAANDVLSYLVRVGHISRGLRGNVNGDLSLQSALLPWTNRLSPPGLSGLAVEGTLAI